MGRLARNIRKTAKQGALFPATILDTGGGKATVRLSINGAIYRMLTITGGPVFKGQGVHVDFTTPSPTVVAPAPDIVGEISIRSRVKIPVQRPKSIAEGIILVEPNGIQTGYPVSGEGLVDCLSDAYAVCKVLIPVCDISGSSAAASGFNIPVNVMVIGASMDGTIVRGKFNVSNKDTIETLTLHNYGTSGSLVFTAITGPTSGAARVQDCILNAVNCGSGSASSVVGGNGEIEIVRSRICGDAPDGTGYGVVGGSGKITIRDTSVYGTTAQFYNDSNIYVYGTTEGVALGECAILSSGISRNNNSGQIDIDYYDGIVYTLGDVTSGSLVPSQVYNGFGLSLLPKLRLETPTSLYYSAKAQNPPVLLARYGLAGHTEYNHTFTGGSVGGGNFVSVDDGEILDFIRDGSNMKLLRHNIMADTNTTLATVAIQTNEASAGLMTLVGEAGSEKLVTMTLYYPSPGIGKYYARVFDPHTGSVLNSGVSIDLSGTCESGSMAGSIESTYYAPGTQVYGSKVIYPFGQSRYHSPNIPWNPPDYWHNSGVLVFDADTGSFDTATVQTNFDLFRGVNTINTGIDQESGYYYQLEVHTEPVHTPEVEEYRLYKVNLNAAPSMVLVQTLEYHDYLQFITGKNNLYGAYWTSRLIKKLSDNSTVGYFPSEITSGSICPYVVRQLDEEENDNRVWFIYYPSTSGSVVTLYGQSVSGASEEKKTITGLYIGGGYSHVNLVNRGALFNTFYTLEIAQG